MRCSIWSALAAIPLFAFAACEGAPAVGPGPVVPTASAVASDAPLPTKDAGPPGLDPGLGLGGKTLCGCGLCEPILSNDPCSADDDCAPATVCHATRCVAKANAEPRKPDSVCTQDLRCDAIEANTCACVKGKCAIAPRKK